MRILPLFAFFFFALPTFAQSTSAPELAHVPGDAFLVAHVKLADLWKDDAMKDVRAILQKAGPKAIEALDKRFSPAPSTVERLTIYLPTPNFDGPADFDPVFLVAVAKPIDRDAFLKQLGKTTSKKAKAGEYFTDADGVIAVRFFDERTMGLGTARAVQAMLDAPATKANSAVACVKELAATRVVTVGVNTAALPPQALEELKQGVPPPLHGLLTVQSIVLSLDMDGDGHLHAKINYPDKSAADAASKSLEVATEMAMKLIDETRKQLAEKVFGDGKPGKLDDLPEAAASLLGLGALQHAEDILKTQPVKRTGDAFTAIVPLPPHFKSALGAATMAGSFLAPAVGKIREAAARTKGANNLKQIGLALHNYHDTFGGLPPAAIVDKKGKAMLSWRVMILPFIEQDNLYKEFHLDEPWDSEHNKKLVEKMPQVYAIPNAPAKPGHTFYKTFVGNGAMFDPIQASTFAQITDGLSNTWMVVEAGESSPWTKPDDLEFDPKKDLPALSKLFNGGFHVLYGDGSVRFYRKVPRMAKEMITRAGGEVVVDE